MPGLALVSQTPLSLADGVLPDDEEMLPGDGQSDASESGGDCVESGVELSAGGEAERESGGSSAVKGEWQA